MTNINDFAKAMMSQLTQYTDDIINDVYDIIEDEANKLASNIKKDSPKSNDKTKHYANGWKVGKDKNGLRKIYIVYNANKPTLTHLLEYGHVSRNGGRVKGYPHIDKNSQGAREKIVKRIEEEIDGK